MDTMRYEGGGRWTKVPAGREEASAGAPGAGQAEPAHGGHASGAERSREELREAVLDVLATIEDPELPVDIYQLGLIYGVDVQPGGRVEVRMTLTSPGCFAAQILPGEVKHRIRAIEGVAEAHVELVWDPPWSTSMMSDVARMALNIDW